MKRYVVAEAVEEGNSNRYRVARPPWLAAFLGLNNRESLTTDLWGAFSEMPMQVTERLLTRAYDGLGIANLLTSDAQLGDALLKLLANSVFKKFNSTPPCCLAADVSRQRAVFCVRTLMGVSLLVLLSQFIDVLSSPAYSIFRLSFVAAFASIRAIIRFSRTLLMTSCPLLFLVPKASMMMNSSLLVTLHGLYFVDDTTFADG